MGIRCITGESPKRWERTAEALGLPAPVHNEVAYCSTLQGDNAMKWLHLAGVVREYLNLELDLWSTPKRLIPNGARWAYVWENDPDGRIQDDMVRRKSWYMQFMELAGAMQAAFAEHERELDATYPLVFWDTWYVPEEGYPDPYVSAYAAREKVVARSFCFLWS